MRISGSGNMSHLAGMSALWHDAEYIPEKQLYTPTVEKGLEGLPLPSEQHQLPEGMDDPFDKQERAYDVAAEQMERGIRGVEFLHGKPIRHDEISGLSGSGPKAAPLAETTDPTRTFVREGAASQERAPADPFAPTRVNQKLDAQAVDREIEKRAQAGSATPQVSQATASSDAAQKSARAQKALEMAEGLGIGLAGVAVGQALDPTALGGAVAAEAAAVVKAAATAKLAVGMSQSIQDTPEAVRTDRARPSDRLLGPDDEDDSSHR